jgi:hypothetical protein
MHRAGVLRVGRYVHTRRRLLLGPRLRRERDERRSILRTDHGRVWRYGNTVRRSHVLLRRSRVYIGRFRQGRLPMNTSDKR